MSAFLRHFIFFFAAVSLTATVEAQDSALRATLERAYNQWRAAVIAKDARAWAGAVTMYRQVLTRNLIVSQRQAFPQAVFAVAVEPPDITGLRLLEVQAVGDTAHLLYFGKINMGGDPAEIPDNVLMLKFFMEKSGWKYDSSKLMKLIDQPELRAQLQKGGVPDFLDYPEFTPPGTAPAVPPLCDPPQHMAGCTLQTFGYKTKMTLNGFDYPVMTDQADKLLVIGGLKNGLNDLTLTVKPTDIPAGEERLLQVDIFVSSGKAGQPGVRVFHHESKDPKLSGTIKLPIVIDDEVVVKGR